MEQIVLAYQETGRKLRFFVNKLLKSGAAVSVRRINYVQNYTLVAGAVKKTEERIVIIAFEAAQRGKLEKFLAQELGEDRKKREVTIG